MTILVAGGAGFIGSNFILQWAAKSSESVVLVDKLTYAGNLHSLDSLWSSGQVSFAHADIVDEHSMCDLLAQHRPRAVLNFAAESHVDRSILGAPEFVQTNVVGVYVLLRAALQYWRSLVDVDHSTFRFLQVSTDEVFGSLEPDAVPFSETSRFLPNSPYSSTKAAADHLVRAWHQTYGFPALSTHCSNNYGPYQYPEKLIPLIIVNALAGKSIPIYGDGNQIRDWLHVHDHCRALEDVLARGRVGDSYNIGGGVQKTNLEVVSFVCECLDSRFPRGDGKSYLEQIAFVKDRPGHDRRYAVDTQKIESELAWYPNERFESGVSATVDWYLRNSEWILSSKSASGRAGSS